MAEWARLANSTISNYMRGVETKLGTKNRFWAMLQKTGNIKYGEAGTDINWAVEYREVPLATNNMEQAVIPQRNDYVQRASIAPVGYAPSDMMTDREKLINGKGRSQLIDYFEEMAKRIERNATRQLREEVYVDSSASGNSQRLSGMETMMAATQTLDLTSATVAGRTANQADVVMYPNDTYAGLSTILGNYAGSWSSITTTSVSTAVKTAWPANKGTLSFDFFSPVGVLYDSSTWGGTANTWEQCCLFATRYMVVHMQRYNDDVTAVNKVFLDRDLYRSFLDKQDSKEHMYVESEYSLRAMGFEDTFMQDGVEISWEWGIPAAVGYGLNFAHVNYHSYFDTLWDIEGPTRQMLNKAYVVVANTFGNLRFDTPKYFAKLKAYNA